MSCLQFCLFWNLTATVNESLVRGSPILYSFVCYWDSTSGKGYSSMMARRESMAG